MILLFFAMIPSLLWDAGSKSAAVLEKAGVREIATTGEAWSAGRIQARHVDEAALVKLDAPGVDYQMNRAGATAAPWVRSNIWRMLKEHGRPFVFDVTGEAIPLAFAEAAAAGAEVYVRVKPEDLGAFQKAAAFAREHEGPALPSRTNFGLVDDSKGKLDEVMNLLARRNLLFEPVRNAADYRGPAVGVGSKDYPAEAATDPYRFAALVRSKIGDENRLVRVYGSETTLARLYGDEQHARLYLVQYGRRPVSGMRVRVRGRYSRIMLATLGARVAVPEDIAVDGATTEFTIPELSTFAIVDLDARPAEVLKSKYSDRAFELTADPAAAQWRNAAAVQAPFDAFGAQLPMAATEVRSRWTKDALYLLYTCPYRSLNLKPVPVTNQETPQLWNWDVAEAFIGADAANIGQYREYQVSPQGEFVDLDIDVLHPKPDGGASWNSGFTVKARIDEAKKVWYGEMRIPLASITSATLHAGDRLRLGLFRLTGLPAERALVAWQPSFRRNFHVPEAFGTLLLER